MAGNNETDLPETKKKTTQLKNLIGKAVKFYPEYYFKNKNNRFIVLKYGGFMRH